jgi:hypothetical protein
MSRQRLSRKLLEFSVVAICGLTFGITVQILLISLIGGVSGTRDFVVYWATGQQLVHHANPYDAAAMAQIEQAAGLSARIGARYMRNPPWTLPITLPLGYFGLRIASLLWSLLVLGCLVVSVRLLWAMHGRPGNRRHLLGYCFAPALVCVILGQTAIFALLGLVLFLKHHRTRPFLAGASLWLCLLKPHLFLPFGVVLLAWIVVSRSYGLLAGALIALAASLAITYGIDPAAWSQYLTMVHNSGMNQDHIPCLSFYLREAIRPKATWIEFVPSALASIWALNYFWPRRERWDWMVDGSLLMLVSILVAPYSWLFDQALAIPALLQGAYATVNRNWLFVLALASALIEIAFLLNTRFPSALYLWTLWTAPAWLGWYLVACRAQRSVLEPPVAQQLAREQQGQGQL